MTRGAAGIGGFGVTLRLMLASDSDREIALALLREASVDGRLTLEDLAERAELVHAARTRDDVAAATADLDAAAPAPVEEAVKHRALFSNFTRQGRWRIASQSRYAAVFGNVKLDLREAVLPGPEVNIEAKAVFGSVELIVPEAVLVELSGGGALSSQELKIEGAVPDGAPVIRIHHRGLCGSLAVRSKPRFVDQMKESWRRWADRLNKPPE
jgi:uncharacterized protein DUF1707/cell wall-active antibiotic response 4TMS protein YvqF